MPQHAVWPKIGFFTPPLSTIRVIVLVCLSLLISACHEADSDALRIGSNTWLGYEPLYLARDQGLLPREQVQLVELVTASDVLHAFRGGLLEGAALTLDEALTLRAEGHDLRVILAFDVSNGADGLVAAPNITSLEQLRGQRVGYEASAVGAVMLEAALSAATLRADEIIPVILPANEHRDALNQGHVDAVVTFEPTLTRLQEEGGRLLFHSGQIPNQIVDVLVVRGDVYEQRQPALRTLLSAWFEAVTQIHGHPLVTAEQMTGRNEMTPEQVLASFNDLMLLDAKTNRQLLLSTPAPLAHTAQMLSESMQRHGLLTRQPELEGLFGTDTLEAL